MLLIISNYFIITAIKNVLKNEDLNPETQEKLLQLQKYQEQQLRDPMSQTSIPATKKKLFDVDNLPSESEPPRKKDEHDNSSGYFYVLIIDFLNIFENLKIYL